MEKNTEVRADWFLRVDSLGHTISTWSKKINNNCVMCQICNYFINCASKGFQAIQQHVLTKDHVKNAELKLGQSRLQKQLKAIGQPSKSSETKVVNTKESVCRAEVLWALKNVQSTMPANSSDDIAEVFKAMFPAAFPMKFILDRTKLSFIVTKALAPYFKRQVADDARQSFFSVLYNETTNDESMKELEVSLCFWSEEREEVIVRHLQTLFTGRARAEDLFDHIENVLKNADLPLNKVLMLGSDGPNINKSVWRTFNAKLTADRGKGLVGVGTCNIHTVHNAFLKGLHQLGDRANALILDIYYYFKGNPSRWKDYEDIQKGKVPLHRILRHVSSRWLTIGKAAQRLYEQWPALTEYFLTFIPKEKKSLIITDRYRRICEALRSNDMRAELCFVSCSAQIFTSFTDTFQRDEPLIHLLYEELRMVTLTLASRICKPGTLVREDIDSGVLFHPDNLLPVSNVTICNNAQNHLKCLSRRERLEFLLKAQKHYESACRHLLIKIPIDSGSLLKHFRFLQPGKRLKERSLVSIVKVSAALPFDVCSTALKDEWRLMRMDDVCPTKMESIRIDHFWKGIITAKNEFGELKFPKLSTVVKASLALLHGHSEVARELSKFNRGLTEDELSMSEQMIDARLTVQDALKSYNNRVGLVPITKELLSLARGANRSYANYLEKKKDEEFEEDYNNAEELDCWHLKERAALDKERKSISELEEKAQQVRREKKDTQRSADSLLQEANARLKLAIAANDLNAIRVAHGMLEGAHSLRTQERKNNNRLAEIEIGLNKRKSTLISDMFYKMPKKD